jgi:hypothetical protein
MGSYDPDIAPSPADWLQTDEGDRIQQVFSYHRRKRIRLQNEQLHAVIHVVVENQLAMGESVVVETLARLMNEGLTRHDALHAIGSVLAADLYELLQEKNEATAFVYGRYLEQLRKLTAKEWRAG